jgi:hypothetical protein
MLYTFMLLVFESPDIHGHESIRDVAQLRVVNLLSTFSVEIHSSWEAVFLIGCHGFGPTFPPSPPGSATSPIPFFWLSCYASVVLVYQTPKGALFHGMDHSSARRDRPQLRS